MKRLLLGTVAAVALAGAAHAQGMSGGCATGQPCSVSALTVAPQSATYTVGPGGNFTTVNAAIAALNTQVLQPGGYVTLSILDGVINEPSAVVASSSFGRQINIQSQHSYNFTLSSIVSSSGSAGAYSYVLQLNSAANIAVGDYLSVYAVSGGTNPSYVAGVWPVTAVNGGSNQVTVTVTGHQAATASGAVTATVTDNKGTLKFTGTDGFDVWNGATSLNIDKINIVGDGSNHQGISLQDGGGRVYSANLLSVYGFGGQNVLAYYASELNSDGYLISSNASGSAFFVQGVAAIYAAHLIGSGGGTGANANANGNITAAVDAVYSGNTGSGAIAATGGVVSAAATTVTGNLGGGLISGMQGTIVPGTLTSANNNGIVDAYGWTAPGGFSTTAQSNIGPTTMTGNSTVNGTSFTLHNQSPSTTYTGSSIDNNGQAQLLYRDGSSTSKWEVGHMGSGSGYDYQIYNDMTSTRILRIDHATNYATWGAPIVPGSVAVGGTNSCSTAGAHAWVTDASVAFGSSTRGGQITGSGSNAVPAYCDGTHWLYD